MDCRRLSYVLVVVSCTTSLAAQQPPVDASAAVVALSAPVFGSANGVATAAAPQDAELDEAMKFLASRVEIPVLPSPVTKVGPRLYQANIPSMTWGELYAVKQQQSWRVILRVMDQAKFPPMGNTNAVWGTPQFRDFYFIIASDSGNLYPDSLPSSGLKTALKASVGSLPNPRVARGVNVLGFIAGGTDGLLGEMRAAGLVGSDLLLVGTVGRGFTDQLFSSYGLSPKNTASTKDLTLTLSATASPFTPEIFQQVLAPRLTIGALNLSISGSIGYSGGVKTGFSVSG